MFEIIKIDFEKMQVMHDGQIFPIVLMLDVDGDKTQESKDAAVIVYGKDGIGFRIFDLRKGQEGLVEKRGKTSAVKAENQ